MSFFVVNLLIPAEPKTMDLSVPSGKWSLERFPEYEKSKAAINDGKCAHTYYIENTVGQTPAALADQAFQELTPILLGASYATGLSVTIKSRRSPEPARPGAGCPVNTLLQT